MPRGWEPRGDSGRAGEVRARGPRFCYFQGLRLHFAHLVCGRRLPVALCDGSPGKMVVREHEKKQNPKNLYLA